VNQAWEQFNAKGQSKQRSKESLLPVAIIFSIIFDMGKADKILEKMRNNPFISRSLSSLFWIEL
jgi:hypothetical protein